MLPLPDEQGKMHGDIDMAKKKVGTCVAESPTGETDVFDVLDCVPIAIVGNKEIFFVRYPLIPEVFEDLP
jgi:hypothetical protein